MSQPPFDTLNLGLSTEDYPDAVDENRRRLLTALHLDPSSLATAGQVHGAASVEVRAPGVHPGRDVLVTAVPGIALAVTSADCLPLLLSVPGAVAVAHSGWRGTVAGAPRAALGALCAMAGSSPARARVHFGPCIRSCCYEVGSDVARRFPSIALTRHQDSWRLDLAAAARAQLLEAGLLPEHLSETTACTACEPTWYFSHRRDRGLTGRHWAIAALSPPVTECRSRATAR